MILGTESSNASRWHALAERVLAGHVLTHEEALGILKSSDDELPNLLAASYEIRRRYFGNTVQFYFLMNAKSGLCPEDCSYCSQSKVSDAEIPRYNILSRDKLLDGARVPEEHRQVALDELARRRSNRKTHFPRRMI